MMPWSMTYVATPIAVAVRVGCFTPSESRAFHLYLVLVEILYRNFVLVVSVWIVSSWRLPLFKSSFVETSMYV